MPDSYPSNDTFMNTVTVTESLYIFLQPFRAQTNSIAKERDKSSFVFCLSDLLSRSFTPQSLKGTRVKNELKLMDPQRGKVEKVCA